MSAKLNHVIKSEVVQIKQDRKVIAGATLEVSIVDLLVIHALLGRTTGSLSNALWRQVDDLYEALPEEVKSARPVLARSDLSADNGLTENLPSIAITDGKGARLVGHGSASYTKRIEAILIAASTRA